MTIERESRMMGNAHDQPKPSPQSRSDRYGTEFAPLGERTYDIVDGDLSGGGSHGRFRHASPGRWRQINLGLESMSDDELKAGVVPGHFQIWTAKRFGCCQRLHLRVGPQRRATTE